MSFSNEPCSDHPTTSQITKKKYIYIYIFVKGVVRQVNIIIGSIDVPVHKHHARNRCTWAGVKASHIVVLDTRR
jgi:hypothetical protein